MQNTPFGRMLLHGVVLQSVQAEVQELHRTASIINVLQTQKLTAMKQAESEQYLLGEEVIKLIKSPSLPHCLGEVSANGLNVCSCLPAKSKSRNLLAKAAF